MCVYIYILCSTVLLISRRYIRMCVVCVRYVFAYMHMKDKHIYIYIYKYIYRCHKSCLYIYSACMCFEKVSES